MAKRSPGKKPKKAKKAPAVHFRGTGLKPDARITDRSKGVWRYAGTLSLLGSLLDSDVTVCGLLCTARSTRQHRQARQTYPKSSRPIRPAPPEKLILPVTADAQKVTCGNCLRNRNVAEVHSVWADVGLRSASFELQGAPGDDERAVSVDFKKMNPQELLVVMDALMRECGNWLKAPTIPLLPLVEGQRRHNR